MKSNHEFRVVITPFCNYRCFFCHSEGFVEECTPLLLSPRDYGFALRTAKQLWGWNTVTITGGEPLISPIYRDVCKIVANEGIKITTVTNASLVSNPKKILADNSQLNISLHTLNQSTYKKITGSSYPLNQVIDTIIGIRSQLPEMIIHINATIIRDVNDEVREMNDLINFASRIGGEAKFIDLASGNPHLIVPYEEIIEKIESLGFTKTEEDTWQIFLQRADQRVIVTRCGFSEEAINRGYRNLFLNPDGTIMADNEKGLTVSVLKEIHEQNTEGFAKKVEWYFPPAKRI